MDIKCSAVTSIKVKLTFDDGSVTENVIALGDLIDVEYNANGARKHACGKVLVVSAIGTDPKAWYIIVDSSDDFESNKARFAPTSILSLEIIRKADTLENVKTVAGDCAVPYLRIVHGRLQWSRDSYEWHPINVDERDIIEDQEGTVPVVDPDPQPEPRPAPRPHDDGIEDANW